MSIKQTVIYKNRRRANRMEAPSAAMWKVAYADFITAMMAFFLLLWLLSVTPEDTLKGVAKYFTPTSSQYDKNGVGYDGGSNPNVNDGILSNYNASSSLVYGSPSRGRKINQANKSDQMSDLEKDQFINIMNNIQQNIELKDFADNLNVDVTNEGLRIQIMDSDSRPMFKPNTLELQPYMSKILTVISKMIRNQPNYIAISGHTASTKDSSKNNMDYWSLSSLRANEVRKFMTNNLIKNDQVAKIVGMANTEPFDPRDQYSAKNIRVTITLLNNASVSKFQQSVPDGIAK